MNEKQMTKKGVVLLLAAVSCALWGSAPSFIKLGYALFQIESSDTMNILLFAGLRFLFAGLAVILGYSVIRKKMILPTKTSWSGILPLALTQTVLQYIMYYIGAAHASGVKVSILSGSNIFFSVIIACLIFRQERLTWQKLLGCLAGLAGMILINLQGNTENLMMDLSFTGEGFVLISACSSSVSAVLFRRYSQKEDPVLLSGYQFALGGLILIAAAWIGGGRIPQVTPAGIAVLCYLVLVSAVAYTLWGILLQYNPVSKISVYYALIPVFGIFLSSIVLREGGIFTWKTLVSLGLVCGGIWIANFAKH